jgi:succinate dehydrogenase / fumarate reductase cytochrome b subunit
MAVTGLMLVGFVFVHMLGNLNAYLGQDALNNYAKTLKDLGPLLWVARAGLIVAFVVHISCAMRLTYLNRTARPVPYAYKKSINSTFASRTMVMSGMIVLFFLLYHLAHFTFHWVGGDIFGRVDALGRPDVYYMFVMGFRNPFASGLYIVGNVLLGLHLTHGIQSMFQSVGINHPVYSKLLQCMAPVAGWGLAIANISFPVSVMLGIITL